MIAHVAGIPVEEAVVALASGTGVALVAGRAWLGTKVARLRRR